jgi:hypothetical protein
LDKSVDNKALYDTTCQFWRNLIVQGLSRRGWKF